MHAAESSKGLISCMVYLLVQDMESWTRDGIAGLQQVVLYALPELDGELLGIQLSLNV
jgi:hypothetical protein